MSRITGSDAKGLMEAYSAVYAPQELTEEQVWEEVENWVNSLLEEGYDLSEYTWEEMYEAYLSEDLMGDLRANAGNIVRGATGAYQGAMRTASNVNQALVNRIKPKPAMPGLPSNYRGAELQQSAAARASQVGTPRQGTAGGPTVGGNTPIGPSPTRTLAPTRTPAPTRTATPTRTSTSPAKPTGGNASVSPTKPTTPTPAPSAPRQKDDSITDMIGRSQVRQGAPINTGSTSSDARAIAAKASVGAAPKPAAAPARPMGGARGRMLGASFDPFDVIKGHLLDEGYADNEEAALKIMANMSEEWKQSIVEGNQRNPESDERTPKSDEAIPGQAARKMPRRGHPDREAFEKWYRANVR
jgi:hypothetical protein